MSEGYDSRFGPTVSCKPSRDVHLQYRRKSRILRVEFSEQIPPELDLFDYAENVHMSRVDVALDYPVPIDLLVPMPLPWMDYHSIHGLSGHLETVLIGKATSPVSYRIYDRGAKKGRKGQAPVTRVEAQVNKCCGVDSLPPDLFRNLVFLPKTRADVSGELSVGDEALLYLLKDHPNKWKHLNKGQRTRLAKLNHSPLSRRPELPFDVYSGNRDLLREQVSDLLQRCSSPFPYLGFIVQSQGTQQVSVA